MEVRYNKKLARRVDVGKVISSEKKLAPELEKILTIGFVESDQCVYFKSKAPSGPPSADLLDLTGNECFFNKIYLEDIISEEVIMEQSILFGIQLLKELKRYFNDSFMVIVSHQDVYCSIRFHKKRENEFFLDDDLDSYELEGILTIED